MFSGTATIVPEREFVQVGLEMPLCYPAMMGATQPGFEVPNDPMHPRQDSGRSPGIPLNPGAMLVATRSQLRVSLPIIRVDLRAWGHAFPHKAVQGLPGCVADDRQPDPASMIPTVFYGNRNQALAGASARFPSAASSDVSLIDFHHPQRGSRRGLTIALRSRLHKERAVR